MSNPWRSYEWLVGACGRSKGQVESRSADEPQTQKFLARKWIVEKKAPRAAAETPPAKAVDAPPVHRAMTSGKTTTK